MTTPISVLAAGVLNGASASRPPRCRRNASARRRGARWGHDGHHAILRPDGGRQLGRRRHRVFVNSVPVVNQASTGVSVGPPPTLLPSGPMTVVQGDPRVMAT